MSLGESLIRDIPQGYNDFEGLMSLENKIIRYSDQGCFSFPARVFAYLALCKDYRKDTIGAGSKNDSGCPNNLPLISSITRKFSPQAVVHAHLAFLKYSH